MPHQNKQEHAMAYKVFISYSHRDQKLRKELDIHLANLKRLEIITSWYDGDIKPGEEWQPQIIEHLNTAQIILLLISANFIASDFCYSTEMKQAIARHDANKARVIPILLRPTDWKGAPFAKLKILPTDAKPVTKWPTHDEGFVKVIQGIREAIDDLAIKSNITKQESPWNIPYERNPLFTGREHVLKWLYERFKTSKRAAISGLGGIGKTQIAVEYAYRYRDDYNAVLWVKAESRESLTSDLVTIAQLLDLSKKQEQEQRLIFEAVKGWFKDHPEWLLIFDNADDLEMVRDFLPTGGRGHILLTTRAHATGRLAQQRIEVEKMEPDEGALFLLHRAKLLDSNALLEAAPKIDQHTASEIVQTMDGLPLALDQAGAYIEETGCGLQNYLTLYRAQGAQLLKDRGGLVIDHPESVATTWLLSFQKVEKANKAAAELLCFYAFLASDAIPKELIVESAAKLGSTLEAIVADPFSFDAAIRELLKYSLVQPDPKDNTLSIHRLVQEVLKEQMDEDTQRLWAERAVRAVSRVFPNPEYTNWDLCRKLLLHAQVCSTLIEQWQLLFTEAAALLNNMGFYLWQRGEYEQVEQLHHRALAIRENVLGPENSDTATSLVHLAFFYNNRGKYEEAEPLYQRALAIRQRALGPDHPDTVTVRNNYASLKVRMNEEST